MNQYILAIDQGTTSSRAILFNNDGSIHATSQQEFTQHFPKDAWIEHEPGDIWSSVLQTCRHVIQDNNVDVADIGSIGITNQRETTLVWDRKTGEPVYNAIVWQDRRTAAYCESLNEAGYADMIADKTGLLIDPYFSATKLR